MVTPTPMKLKCFQHQRFQKYTYTCECWNEDCIAVAAPHGGLANRRGLLFSSVLVQVGGK